MTLFVRLDVGELHVEIQLGGLLALVVGAAGRDGAADLSLIHISEPTRPY